MGLKSAQKVLSEEYQWRVLRPETDNPEKIVAKSLKLQARQSPKLPNEFCQA